MLLLIEVDLISKKRKYKQNLVLPGSFGNGKIVFILLTKIIILYVKLTIINVKKFGLKFIFR